jgi:hypothetical protein
MTSLLLIKGFGSLDQAESSPWRERDATPDTLDDWA